MDKFIGRSYSLEVDLINNIFRDVLKEKYVEVNDSLGVNELKDRISQEVSAVANLGTSTIRDAFIALHGRIENNGNTFITNDRVVKIFDESNNFNVETKSGREFYAKNVIVATGKCDFTIVPQLIEQYKLETLQTEPTLGFRLAIPNSELQKMKDLGNNPKLKLHLVNGDTVKTHCFTFGGEVMAYICGDYFLVGGRADYLNPTNIATANILYKFSSGDLKKSRLLVKDTLHKIRNDYPTNVIYQDLASFMDPHSKPQETDVPPCRGGKLGNLLSYYPEEIIDPIREFIYEIAYIYGIDITKASIFGPSSEWFNEAIATSLDMETTRKGLYIIGDGSGVTQGIIAAAVTGHRAAKSILEKLS